MGLQLCQPFCRRIDKLTVVIRHSEMIAQNLVGPKKEKKVYNKSRVHVTRGSVYKT